MKRALVFGASGQLGSEIVRLANERGLAWEGLARDKLDATRKDDVLRAVEAAEPDLVLNCVAYTNVDKAEDEPEGAFAANAIAARNVAIAARKTGARLQHMSTSYVFDGTKEAPYEEGDVPRPLGVYSASKLAGEHLALTFHPDATVVRLVSVYGAAGAKAKESGNFVEAFVKRIKAGQPLKVVDDQWITPSYTRDLAEGILALAQLDHLPPVVNLANEGRCSWYTVAEHLKTRLGGDAPVTPIPGAQWPYRSPRPRNSTMSTRLFRSLTGTTLPSWQDALDRYLREKGYA